MGIFNGVFVMRDHQTGSVWSHYTGEALDGPMKGKRLSWLQLGRATSSRLLAQHPEATTPPMASMRFREREVPLVNRAATMGERMPKKFLPTIEPAVFQRMPRHTHGLGVAVGSSHKFYALDLLGSVGVLNDRVGDVPVVVMLHDDTAGAAAYSRCTPDGTLSFEAIEHGGFAAMQDSEGTVWEPSGRAVAGPRKGQRLTSVRSMVTDWYGWGAYFPDSDVYRAPSGVSGQTDGSDGESTEGTDRPGDGR